MTSNEGRVIMSVGMTVGELIGRLRAMDQKAVLVMSVDAEGNDYSPLADVQPANYFPVTNWSGDIYDYDPQYHDAEEVSAVVLTPRN